MDAYKQQAELFMSKDPNIKHIMVKQEEEKVNKVLQIREKINADQLIQQ